MSREQIVEQLMEYLFSAIQYLFPPHIWNMYYFKFLIEKYMSVEGFMVGFLLLALVIFASDWVQDEKLPTKKRGIIRILALVAFINALDIVYFFIASTLSTHLFQSDLSGIPELQRGAFNPLSLMVISLVMVECYSDARARAFFFGISTFGFSVIMFGSSGGLVYETFALMRAIVAGFICVICTKRKHVFSAYIWLSCFCAVTQGIVETLIHLESIPTFSEFSKLTLSTLANYKDQYLISVVITALWVLYEVFILTEKKPQKKKAEAA